MNSVFEKSPNKKYAVTLFASGEGTNAENCMKYFQHHPSVYINLIVSNNPSAPVLEKAKKYHVPVKVILKQEWADIDKIIDFLKQQTTDLIVLAGYLALLPPPLVKAFSGRIINLHPALLPKFGGKGMYGAKVHQAVLDQKETETGITIHEVNEEYDKGKILFQKKIKINSNDTVSSIEKNIRELEFYYLPRVIESILSDRPLK